jgi:hypothetical protein
MNIWELFKEKSWETSKFMMGNGGKSWETMVKKMRDFSSTESLSWSNWWFSSKM